ncbi:HD domain-containing protein [Bacillus sp. EB600]|uniref:HD domain-containing protein n=1 Tax=Bacillus sp. EB600 TaxID=2806345 RepID=UPI00210C4398|nr:HD domain-containing protein [Bacillus sp. EB600]MCQ6277835.1 HD domain-containing protein [Bacillus sp. EB600]
MKNGIIQIAETFVQKQLGEDATGHDWFHVDRVRRNALLICKQEAKGDPFIVELASLLHDIPDEKLNETIEIGQEKLDSFMQTLRLSFEQMRHINEIIRTISFKGGNGVELTSVEAKIVQDADRLDAIGAIGIARAFAYGGKKGQPIYDPNIEIRKEMSLEEYRNGKSSSIHHFYEKLLKLTDMLNTETAKSLAASRQQFMISFLTEFYKEWNGQL